MRFPAPYRPTVALAVGLAVALAAPTRARADQIDRVMVHDAPDIVAAARGLKAQNVAVLKFQVKVGDAAPTFQAGTEGVEMIHRMENILILGLDPARPAYTVLTGAGPAAAALARSSRTAVDWTTAEGRKKLVGLTLPVAWNDKQKATPDAYLTGVVRTTKDLREVFVDLYAFTRADPANLRKIGTLGTKVAGRTRGIRTDRAMLASMGQTFSTSRSMNKARARDMFAPDDAAVADAANRESAPPDPNGLTPPAGPVRLEVLFDGQVMAQSPDAGSRGEYQVANRLGTLANQGQAVTFRLENTGKDRVAALLCVNGKNTIAIDGEELTNPDKPRAKFRMYVLDPGKKYEIKGFLKSETGTYAPFEVLPADKASEMFDTMNAETRGKIQMFVYGAAPLAITGGGTGATGGTSGTESAQDAEMTDGFNASGLASSERTLGKARTLAAARQQLEARTKVRSLGDGKLQAQSQAPKGRQSKPRSLIIESSETRTDGSVQVVPFEYDEQPLDSLVITYYSKDSVPTVVP